MTTHEDLLRAWARGAGYPVEAATELLLRAYNGKFARPGNLWVVEGDTGGFGIEFSLIPVALDGLEFQEQDFLLFAASLSDWNIEVDLGQIAQVLDREVLPFVFAALAHANGAHEHTELVKNADGTFTERTLPSVYPWPDAAITTEDRNPNDDDDE